MKEYRHRAILEVDLNAIKTNLGIYQTYLRKDTKVMVMVKANAYGSGIIEIARLLETYNGDGYLGVAYADEGVELRRAGVKSPIFVMNVQDVDFENLVKYDLQPEIYSLSILKKLVLFAEKHNTPIIAHMKLETGMNRLGFVEEELDEALNLVIKSAGITIKSVLTHLVASAERKHDDFTLNQVIKFERMYDVIVSRLYYRPMRHVLNTGGIVRFPEYQFDMVRLGIGIYGVDVTGEIQPSLAVVNHFKGVVSQLKKVKRGTTVGYSRSGVAGSDMTIAVVNIGYADGFRRQAGNGNFAVLIRGKKAYTVGNVCMDMMMVDVTHVTGVSEGDEVEVFGRNLPVQALADCFGTISYEVFTGVSARVRRIYIGQTGMGLG